VTTDKKLLFCNVDFDTDMTPGRSSRQKQSCLDAQFYYLLCGYAGDGIILDASPEKAFTAYLSDLGIVLPRQCPDGEPLSDYTAFPWGWSARAVDRFRHYGAKTLHPRLECVGTVNSRRFCHRISQRHNLGIAGSTICESAEEIRAHIRTCRSFPLVVKPEHGNAGIGFIHVQSPDQADDGRIDRLYSRQGATAIIEPWVKGTADISSRLQLDSSGRTDMVTHHQTLNNRAGVYFGNLLMPENPLVEKWRPLLDAGASIVARELYRSGYFGPAGLDWILYTKNETGEATCALVDINARQPMSFVADSLRGQLAEDKHCLFLFAPRRNYPALTDYESWRRGCAGKAFDAERRTGIMLFTPLSYAEGSARHRPLRHGFFIAGNTRQEMLAYEKHLRSAFKTD